MFTLHSPHSLKLSPFAPIPAIQIRVSRFVRASATTGDPDSDERDGPIGSRRLNYEGVQLEEAVDLPPPSKSRLDSWISSRILGISRARVQSSIRCGLVAVNDRIIDKVSYPVRAGDKIKCTISELQPLRAEPEDIPLDIKYEDDHLLVVNKPSDMVVHPAPGNANGTLVNAILHHCSLPTVALPEDNFLLESKDTSDDDDDSNVLSPDQISFPEMNLSSSVRPGIVHRLDKGTSGLIVVAKDELSHAHLSEQFKARTIQRVYVSLTVGVPSSTSGRVQVPIGRDLNNRIRMTAVIGGNCSGRSRHAASRYKLMEVFADGGSALVEWRLETGRTHQIRVHAKYLGIPLLGDEVYGGTRDMALSFLQPRTPRIYHSKLIDMVSSIQRPCLHAMVLGFKHPYTGENMHFSCPPPADFSEVCSQLRQLSASRQTSQRTS